VRTLGSSANEPELLGFASLDDHLL
jgi:hypothetical protein